MDSDRLVEEHVPHYRHLSGRTVSCVIPALNEHDNLSLLLPTLETVLRQTDVAWEVIIVDDGSDDATPLLMAHWCQHPGIHYVQLSRNFGKEAALSAGLDRAKGDIVILLDADMQHPPELIPIMLARWQAGVDNVYAVRECRRDEGWIKRAGSRLFYRLLSGSHSVHVPPNASDFRLMDRKVLDALLMLNERTRFMKGLYAWVGYSSEAVPYMPAVRAHGDSRFSLRKLTRLALHGLTAFTTLPLRVVSITGFIFALLAFGYGVNLVISYLLHGHPISGWTTIVAAILFFSGINLMSLGVVGEYVARIFDEVKARPLYLVRNQIGDGMARPAEDERRVAMQAKVE